MLTSSALAKRVVLVVLSLTVAAVGMAARTPVANAGPFISVTVTVDNTASALDLVRVSGSLDHGCWTNDIEPPGVIRAHTSGGFEAESCGAGTGAEGHVLYRPWGTPDGTNFDLYFDDPFMGTNSGDLHSPSGCTGSRDGPGSGNHIFITYKLACTDSAADGIYDVWKLHGVWLDGTTSNFECGGASHLATCQFIDLPAMGASTSKADIFLQLDWMADANHSLQLSQAAIQRVVTAFATSPFKAPNGGVGITLHVDEGANSVNFPAALSKARRLPLTTNLGSGAVNNYKWTTGCTGNTCFDTIKNQAGGFTSTGRTPIFHYVVSAQDIAGLGNSGISRGIPGSDLIISLGSFCNTAPPCVTPLAPALQGGTRQMQAGTLMHELGHNLGLGHGGGDGTNNKPNYFSIMNYDWQLGGLIVNGVQGTIDYSHAAQPSLNDNALNEQFGLGANAGTYGTMHYCPATAAATAGFVTVNSANGPIDWNCDGTVAGGTVSFDVRAYPIRQAQPA